MEILGKARHSTGPRSFMTWGGIVINPELPLGQSEKLDVDVRLDTGRDRRCPNGKHRLCSLTRFDYAFIGILLLLLFPAFRLARLPFRIDLVGFAGSYWIGTAAAGAFFAIVFAIIGLPLEQTLMPCLSRYGEKKGRIVIALVLAAWMVYLLGLRLGLMITVDALGVAELMERRKKAFESALIDIFFPALYLFCGVIMVYAFNHAIAGIRFAGTYDVVFDHLDRLLFHVNVSNIAHWSLSHLPRWFYTFLELVYYGLFGRVAGILVLTALLGNQQYAVKYVRSLLICYSIALVVFIVWPAKGPYSICPLHLSSYPRSLPTFWMQELLLAKVRMLWAHHLTPDVTLVSLVDYYIGFPSMHAALPIIAIWFCRPWKIIALFLLVLYVTLLLPSIILLEWHYMVDVLGGVVTAFLAIWLTERISKASAQDDL